MLLFITARYYVQFITDNVGPPGECQYYRDRNKFSLQRKLYQEEERKQITRKKNTQNRKQRALTLTLKVCVSVNE